jgi:FMN phosphatase YigB (HAD superfamily)
MFDSVAPPAYSASLPPFDTLIFDIGDVFFTWKPHSHSLIPPKTLKAVVTSPTWYEFERGKITQALAYEVASKENNIDANDLARSFDLARQTLRFDASLVAFVREMKTVHRLKVYAMSNMSLPDYEYLRVHKKDFGWDIFDDIIISACIGIRKPDLGFYNSVIQCTGVDPARAIFIDDKLDNVLSARSVGMRGIVFQSTQQAMHCIRNAVCDPVARARAFLECNAGCMNSTTNTGVVIRDNFAQMLILEVTGDG